MCGRVGSICLCVFFFIYVIVSHDAFNNHLLHLTLKQTFQRNVNLKVFLFLHFAARVSVVMLEQCIGIRL